MDVSNTTFSYFVFLKSYITIVLSVCFLQFQIYWSYTYNFFLLSRRYSIENLSELFCKKSVACLRWHNGFEGPLLLDDSRRKFCNISFEKLTCVPDCVFLRYIWILFSFTAEARFNIYKWKWPWQRKLHGTKNTHAVSYCQFNCKGNSFKKNQHEMDYVPRSYIILSRHINCFLERKKRWISVLQSVYIYFFSR